MTRPDRPPVGIGVPAVEAVQEEILSAVLPDKPLAQGERQEEPLTL